MAEKFKPILTLKELEKLNRGQGASKLGSIAKSASSLKNVGGMAKWLLPLLGLALPWQLAATAAPGIAAHQIPKFLRPTDPWYNPTSENWASWSRRAQEFADITPYTRSILEGEGLEDKLRRTTTAPTTAADIQSINARKAREALNRTIGGDQNALELRRMEEERQKRLSMGFPGGGKEGEWATLPDGTQGFWTRDSYGNPVFNQIGGAGAKRYEKYGKNPYDNPITPQEEGQWNPYTGQWEQGAGYIDPFQQAQLDLQRQQMEEEGQWRQQEMQWQREQERNRLAAEKEARLANLKANPASWLEYAALANQPAAIQPWMLPLMPQQYQGMGAGEALPGWTGSADAQNLAQLTTPSAQYMARMTPSSQQQYYGYEKARTGANPSDTDWRLWNRAPPGGGSYRGLSFNR